MFARISLVALLGGVAYAAPVHAQNSTQSPAAKADTALVPWPAKPVGVYDLTVEAPDGSHPVPLTISDSASHLIGYVASPEGATHDLTVAVTGTEMTLVGETPSGALKIVMHQRGKNIVGTWSMGDGSNGTLTAVKRPAK